MKISLLDPHCSWRHHFRHKVLGMRTGRLCRHKLIAVSIQFQRHSCIYINITSEDTAASALKPHNLNPLTTTTTTTEQKYYYYRNY